MGWALDMSGMPIRTSDQTMRFDVFMGIVLA